MPIQYLKPDAAGSQFKNDAAISRQRYRFASQVTGTGDWVILPPSLGDVAVSVAPASGTAKLEYTQSTVTDVESGAAIARTWPNGDVSSYTDSMVSNSITAIRCVSTANADFVITA